MLCSEVKTIISSDLLTLPADPLTASERLAAPTIFSLLDMHKLPLLSAYTPSHMTVHLAQTFLEAQSVYQGL